jgi:hypothetical protein
LCLLQGNSTKPAEPANSKMNVAFTPLVKISFFDTVIKRKCNY